MKLNIYFLFLLGLLLYFVGQVFFPRFTENFIFRINKTINKILQNHIFQLIIFGSLLMLFFVFLVAIIALNGFSPWLKAFVFLSLFLLYLLVVYFGLYPAQSANLLVRSTIRLRWHKVLSGFWPLYDSIRFWRHFIIAFLLIFSTGIALLNFYLFHIVFNFSHNNILFIREIIIAFIFFAVLALVLLLDFIRAEQEPRVCVHRREFEVNKIADTLAIAAGINKPRIGIACSDTPTAFTVFNLRKKRKHVIYLTVGLLNLLNENELKAVIAHEISHIKANQTADYHYLELLLQFLKVVASGFLILILSAYSFVFFYVWLLVLLIFSLQIFYEQSPYETNIHSPAYVAFILLMPTFALINFIGAFIYYFLGYNEDYYADLNAVLLTRYPAGLYRALAKVSRRGSIFEYGAQLRYMYFTGENLYARVPFPQPSARSRQALLIRVDETLRNLKVKKELKIIHCSLCHRQMKMRVADSHYIKRNVAINQCPNCLSVWFDKYELAYIANLTLLCDTAKLNKNKIKYEFFENKLHCPLCGVFLRNLPSPNIPQKIHIWQCPSCGGNFMLHQDIYEFGQYKQARMFKKTKA